MKAKIILLILINLNLVGFAQNTPNNQKKWGIETNLVWPFIPGINIWQVKFTPVISYKEKASTELIIGTFYRNTSDDPNAMVHKEIGGTVGLRHFFYKGFHIELVSHVTYASEERNKIDGKDYSGMAFTPEFYAGYRFDFNKQNNINFYLTPQAGFGRNIYADLGPETQKANLFPVLSLLAGFKF